MNKDNIFLCKDELVNNDSYRLELNNYISSMIWLIERKWIRGLISYSNIDNNWINIIDYIKLKILSNIIYLNWTHEWNYEDLIIINPELLNLIDEQIVLTILWKNKVIKIWKNIKYKYWYEINWKKNRVFLRQNNDYLIELNILPFLKYFLDKRYNIKKEENNFVFNLHLNNNDFTNINDIFNSLKENTKKYNFNNGSEYEVNWNFKDFLEEKLK